MEIKLKDVQKWYADKLNKGTDELDGYDSFCAKVAYDYACVIKGQGISDELDKAYNKGNNKKQ